MLSLRAWISIAVAGIMMLLLTTTFSYRKLYLVNKEALATQSAQIEATNKAAKDRLAVLEQEADALRQRQTLMVIDQKRTDDEAIRAIADADARATRELVRVRVACPAGSSGGSTTSGKTSAAGTGKTDANASTGLLAGANSQRLNKSLSEIETLQAAFNSCKEFNR